MIGFLVESTTASRVKEKASLFADLNDLVKENIEDQDFVKNAFNILTGEQPSRYHFLEYSGICVMQDHDERERCLQTIWYNMDSGMTW